MTRNKKKRLPQKNMLQPQGITHQRWFFPGAWREPFDSRTSQAMEFHQGRLELRHPALGEVWKWCTRYTPNPIVRPFPFNHAIDIPWMFGIHGCFNMFHFSKVFSTAFREEIPIGRNPSCRWWEPIVFYPSPQLLVLPATSQKRGPSAHWNR